MQNLAKLIQFLVPLSTHPVFVDMMLSTKSETDRANEAPDLLHIGQDCSLKSSRRNEQRSRPDILKIIVQDSLQ